MKEPTHELDSELCFRLNNGVKMPSLAFGTWELKGNECFDAVSTAIKVGYRHIDTAAVYGNEKEVGRAIKQCLSEGVCKREDLFITTKLWCNMHHPDKVCHAYKESLNNLQLDYIDLYLMHWPMAFKEGSDLIPKDNKGLTIGENVNFVDTWKAMEKLLKEGKCKGIGISNFNLHQLKTLLNQSIIKPTVLQIEIHPYLIENELLEFCQKNNIVVMAYSPLGHGEEADGKTLFDDPIVKKIAEKYNKSEAQILLRFNIDRDCGVVVKSRSGERISDNKDMRKFKLSPDDVKQLEKLNKGHRFVEINEARHLESYPFSHQSQVQQQCC